MKIKSHLEQLGDPESPPEPTPTPTTPAEVVDPLTGEIVPVTDADALIELWTRLREIDQQIYAAKTATARALAALTTGEARTRRVQGQRLRCVVEMPPTNWDNSRLKEAWHAFPRWREEYLRIAEVAPNLREVAKLRNMSGPPDLETFRAMVLGAERESTATPRIKVEE